MAAPRPLRIRGLLAALLGLYMWRTSFVGGVEFFLDDQQIGTDGAGIVNISDIRNNNDSALICQSELNSGSLSEEGHWYLVPSGQNPNINVANVIYNMESHGWRSNRATDSDGHRIVRLMRWSITATEGRFSCDIPGDRNTPKALHILYSISISLSIQQVVRRLRRYTVICTASGGNVTGSSSLTGPGLPNSGLSLMALGSIGYTGENTYTVTSGILSNDVGSVYYCTASNDLSSPRKTLMLAQAGAPVLSEAVQTSATNVSVTWSHPTEGAPVTGYIVHYTRGDDNSIRNKTVVSSTLSTVIIGLTSDRTYIISVEATVANGLSGESREIHITLKLPPDPPQDVAVVDVEPVSVRVSWLAVDDADKYIVTFSQSRDNDQQGLCSTSYTPSVTATTSPASIDVGQTVDSTTENVLKAYTTYFITVASVSDVSGRGEDSEPFQHTTIQTSAAVAPSNVRASAESSTIISVQWDGLSPCGQVNGLIVKYRVQYTAQPDGMTQSKDQTAAGDYRSGAETSLTGLTPFTNYSIRVAAVNEEGDIGIYSDTITEQTQEDVGGPDLGGPEENSSNVIGVVVGVIVAVFAVILVIAIVAITIWLRYRGRNKSSSYRPSPEDPPSVPLAPVHYSKSSKSTSNDDQTTGPKITRFPDDKHVLEGERIVFRVTVTGTPRPKLTWYHDGEEVVPDYSKELSENGFLTMPSAEAKHSGDYQLVAVNKAGRMEKEVKLFVIKEDDPSPYVARKQSSFSLFPVDQFGDYVTKSHSSDNRDFKDQYTELDKDADYPKTIGTSPNFKLLNRFANITVYDNNRITLRPIEGHSDCQRDFINACYVDGYKSRNKFIATQGPLPETVVDFWHLVWQEKTLTIVVLTNLVEGTKIKCQQYWPDSGTKSDMYGPFQVTIIDEEILADYTTRSLLVQLKGSSERGLYVTQFHFTAWPDHGVPDYATPILAFYQKVKRLHKPSKGPMLVHCSAGVGSTGALITIDRALDQIQKEKVVDIAGIIQQLRNQRMKMVQNLEQYIFIHDAILEAVTCGDTQIVACVLRWSIQTLSQHDAEIHSTGFENQFKVLEQVSPNPREVKRDKALGHPDRNRSNDFLPSDRWRVVLKGNVDDYIHAVVINGYKHQRAFIIAQSPMQSTARDFWKMVSDRKSGVIVTLCDTVEGGKEVCHQYWPSSGVMQVGEFTVDHIAEKKLKGFIIRTFSVVHEKSHKGHQVYQLHMTNWTPDGQCSNLTIIINVIAEVSVIQRRTGNNPIVVHCSDTVSRSGMFCAIATTIERCKTEGVVDVFQVVKALRVQKPGAVRTVMQYRLIFNAVLVFVESLDTYANFIDVI